MNWMELRERDELKRKIKELEKEKEMLLEEIKELKKKVREAYNYQDVLINKLLSGKGMNLGG